MELRREGGVLKKQDMQDRMKWCRLLNPRRLLEGCNAGDGRSNCADSCYCVFHISSLLLLGQETGGLAFTKLLCNNSRLDAYHSSQCGDVFTSENDNCFPTCGETRFTNNKLNKNNINRSGKLKHYNY